MGKFNLAEHIQAAQPPKPRDIETITGEIMDAKRAGGEAILTIGKGLIEAKALLSHGEWLPWLEERVEISERVAQNFMRLARNYSNPNTLSDLGASKALMLLALPEAERNAFMSEVHQVNGEEKTVIDMTSRELDAAIKERDAALKAAEEAEADRRSADEAREKLSRDMELANERIAGLNAEVEEHSARAREAQDAAARLEKELEELRSRPVEVAVEVDQAAVEAARKEVEDRMRGDLLETNSALQRTKLEREQALIAQRTAEDAKSAAQRELEQAQVELKLLREQAAKTEKKAALSANEDLVLFNTPIDGTTILKRLEECGRVCYKSESRITETSAPAFAGNILKRGHEAVLEHCSFTVKFTCDRGVSHEIVRHRLASYCQESTRYCNYGKGQFGKEITVIRPCFLNPDTDGWELWKEGCEAAETAYFNLLDCGCSPQEARSVLPNSLKTEVVMSANIREWRHFLKLRCSPAAHPQMREVALVLLKEVHTKVPVLFDDLWEEYGTNGG